MLWVALILAVFVGLSLGLIGSGGSVLTLPIMVYLLNINTILATSYSLCVVGVSSLIGFFQYFKKGWSDLKMALIFGIPSIVSVYFTRAFLLPTIPDVILSVGKMEISKSFFLMLLFAILMLTASVSMIKSGKNNISKSYSENSYQINYVFVFGEGIIVGILTGLVGAGGGFLIIPALVILSGMSMKKAIGTSLLIIAVKSLSGFVGDLQSNMPIDFIFLFEFTGATIVGITLGTIFSEKIHADKLKSGFGWFVLIFALFIIFKEFYSQLI
jgi:uncharacterized membrane protein YfcA